MNNLKVYFKHRLKLLLAALIRFVFAHPKLFTWGMKIGNRIPALKWYLWRVHATTRNAAPQKPVWNPPNTVPMAARSVYLQLTAGHQDN
ncbi:hypothetical protein [Pseudomonas sp.]|uniref:hypothetical protein n=1 Tax=Pseudomonas sp. TaxID=306 RepID=UPI00258E5458|nr:hypothetical protein [Pseudomonas sp.]